MCSSTLGPASEPSLVTWPTMIKVTLLFRMPGKLGGAFAHLSDRAGCGLQGFRSDGLDRIDHRDPGFRLREHRENPFETDLRKDLQVTGVSWSRCARSATCSADSSPVTYSAGSLAARTLRACSNRVDLPMPGSPPMRTTHLAPVRRRGRGRTPRCHWVCAATPAVGSRRAHAVRSTYRRSRRNGVGRRRPAPPAPRPGCSRHRSSDTGPASAVSAHRTRSR